MLISRAPKEGLMVKAVVNMHNEPIPHRWIVLNDPYISLSSNIFYNENSKPKVLVVNLTSTFQKNSDLVLNYEHHYTLVHESYLAYQDSRLMTEEEFMNTLNSSSCNNVRPLFYELDEVVLEQVRNSFLNYKDSPKLHKDFLNEYLNSINLGNKAKVNKIRM